MEKKPILIFVTEYFAQANNAPSARFQPLVHELSFHYDVRVYTSRSLSKNSVGQSSITTNFIPFPDNTKHIVARTLQESAYATETFFRLLFSKGSIYYITSPSFLNCISAYVYCWIFGKKYVVDIRDDYPRVFFEHKLIRRTSLLGKSLAIIERNIYKNSSMVIAATDGLRKSIGEKYKNAVYLFRNGFSEKIFHKSEDKYFHFTLVFHGTLGYFQDLDLLIDIGKLIDSRKLPIKVLVIGKGSEDFKLKVEDLPLCITFMGVQPYKKIPALINRAHIGLSLRKPGRISEDSFPVKVYEYIGAAVPIINSPLSEAGYFIQKNKIGYHFDFPNAEDILEKVICLKEDPDQYNQIVNNILSLREQFSNERMSKKLAEQIIQLTDD